MRNGIGITTFASDTTSDVRYDIIDKCLESVNNLNYDDLLVVVVNDGSNQERLLEILSKYDKMNIIHKSENGGISKSKNTCIKYLYDNGVDNMFLMDDDIIVKDGFIELYSDSISISNIDHFNYIYRPHSSSEKINRGVDLLSCDKLYGCLMTITRRMVEKIGYFRILPHKYGHEHTEYTHRSIRNGFSEGFIDVCGSDKYITLQELSLPNQSSTNLATQLQLDQNLHESSIPMESDYVPFID